MKSCYFIVRYPSCVINGYLCFEILIFICRDFSYYTCCACACLEMIFQFFLNYEVGSD